MSELIAAFRDIVGASGVLAGDDVGNRMIHVWRQEPIRARCIVRPANTDEVAAIVKICHERRQRIVPHGGLTGLVQGCNVTPEDVVLSLERMNRIEDIDTAGRTMTVQAGVPLATLQQEAERVGLMFPLDLGARGSCQIGGNVSTNAGGNHVIRYGMTRENVLGLEAVLADGTVITALNDMIKNNAGYDLKHLFIGTEGTLGIVTRVVIRLREAAHGAHTAFVACTAFPEVVQFLKYIDRELAGALSAFEVMWKEYFELVTTAPATNVRPVPLDHDLYVLVESLASSHAGAAEHFENVMARALEEGLIADAAVAKSENDRRAMWRIRDSVEQLFRYGPPFFYDVSLGIRHMDAYIREVKSRLKRHFPEHRCFTLGHIGDGNIHFVVNVAEEYDLAQHEVVNACIYEPLQPFKGSISAEHGIGTEKKAYLHLSRSAAELALMKCLKQALDPRGILNPGKVFD